MLTPPLIIPGAGWRGAGQPGAGPQGPVPLGAELAPPPPSRSSLRLALPALLALALVACSGGGQDEMPDLVLHQYTTEAAMNMCPPSPRNPGFRDPGAACSRAEDCKGQCCLCAGDPLFHGYWANACIEHQCAAHDPTCALALRYSPELCQ